MRRINLFFAMALVVLVSSYGFAEVKMTTRSWANNADEFVTMQNDIAVGHVLNYLNFNGAKVVSTTGISASNYVAMTDSLVGQLGGEGRIQVDGLPGKVVYYLGRPRSIKEIIVYTGNIDSRGNQDFEIRLMNNESKPGVMPQFNGEPTLTTGDVILGANGGGFKTSFRESEDGKFIGGKKYDWIEFRIWQTYPTQAGQPGKSKTTANSWNSLIELQVVGDEADPDLYASPEEKGDIMAKAAKARMEMAMQKVSPELGLAAKQIASLKMAINHLAKTYPDKYDGKKYLEQLKKYEQVFESLNPSDEASIKNVIAVGEEFLKFRRQALLANPLLSFDKILVRTAKNAGLEANWMSNTSRGKGDYGNKLQVLSLSDPNAELKPLVEPKNNSFLGDVCLKWDAKKILVTALSDNRTWEVFEIDLEKALAGQPVEYKQISPFMGADVDNVEGCFIPDGSYLFISNASMMGVPCIGGAGHVGNIFRVEEDLTTCRQLTYEQDQDWCPTLLNNGRVMYLRWEYVDINHYFTRIMMHMNPDGTNQVEYYGSGSYWPNSMFYGKAIPGHPSKFVTIVTGHHGAAQRQGELHILDPKLGRKEAEGSVQQIPFRGKKVEPIVADQLVDASWPKFLFPCPLSEDFFLVSCRPTPASKWGIYLVDTFDNMLLIKESDEFGIFEPNALVERPCPPVIPDRTLEKDKNASVYITDVYFGPGLENVPRGTVKKMRVFGYQYGYRGIGNHNAMGEETSWDSKVLLGEVNVEPDGSANFNIPSNVPLALQPLDKDGNALQLMRSWLTGMPGERVTCSGCHENQNSVTPAKFNMAARRAPEDIKEFNGPKRPMGFMREVQPVLDKYCVGCHNGSKPNRPNFQDITNGPRGFSNSYWALMPYLRRPGPESDTHMFYPMEYHVNTSPLIQMLRDGNHYNVKLDDIAWRELALWIDMNMPFHATWTEVAYSTRGGNTEGVDRMAQRTRELRTLYANVDEDPEHGAMFKLEKREEYVKPPKWDTPNTAAPAGSSAAVVNNYEAKTQAIDLGEGVMMNLAYIPSGKFVIGDDSNHPAEVNRNEVVIEKPFYMGTTEVTNQMYLQFTPKHDSKFMDQQWKDHTHGGYPAWLPTQPVIRITWQEAQAFCKWLSEKTGKKFRLPTEAEWEWAAKAGTDQPFWWSKGLGKATGNDNGRLTGVDVQFGDKANLADASLELAVVSGVNPQPVAHQPWQAFLPRVADQNDNQFIPGWDADLYASQHAGYQGSIGTARYVPNPWGLYDMTGNVCEFTQSDYVSYPYNAADGRNAGDLDKEKVVRGGSWFDRPAQARNGYRMAFPTWQKVYNVGFRVVCEE